jgi:hypothetical protein
MLFDQKERTPVEPKQPGENDFQFYDTAAGVDYGTYRELVNGWIAELPEAARPDPIARLKADDRFGYQSSGHFWPCRRQNLNAPDWLAGAGGSGPLDRHRKNAGKHCRRR